MKRNYHIFSHGNLVRDENTLKLVSEEEDTTYIPVNDVDAVYAHGQINVNTELFKLLDEHTVELHVFGWNGKYRGGFRPRRGQQSGKLLVSQVRAYEHPARRRKIAKEIIESSIHNMRRNVTYYENRGYNVGSIIDGLDVAESSLSGTTSIEELMGVEASARESYYNLFDIVTPDEFAFTKRMYNPPQNRLNALISYGNMLLYASMSSAINATGLDPTVGYLHEPAARRNTLALDLADIFKPTIVDRVLLRVVNRNQVQPSDFRKEEKSCLLDETGRKTLTKEYESLLEDTVEHPQLNRNVSYQYLLRLEAMAIKKYVLTGEPYDGFKRWW